MLLNVEEQYVRWIQTDKLRLIHQSLDSQPTSQPAINDQRWKVSIDLENIVADNTYEVTEIAIISGEQVIWVTGLLTIDIVTLQTMPNE